MAHIDAGKVRAGSCALNLWLPLLSGRPLASCWCVPQCRQPALLSAVCAVRKGTGWAGSRGDACCTGSLCCAPQLWAACEPAEQTAVSSACPNYGFLD